MSEIMDKLAEAKLVPVVRLSDEEQAVKLGESLVKCGLPLAEITLRSDAALGGIRKMAEAFPDMLIIAGTVLTPEQADAAIEAGAKALVSPGFNPDFVDYCLSRGYEIIPGVDSPSMIEIALAKGLRRVKFFPAEVRGGVKFLKSIAPVYAEMSFMPTGGISKDNISDYLALPNVYACGGSWIVKTELFEQDRYDEVERRITEALSLIQG